VWFTDHMEVDDSGRSERGALAELGRSARGWHGVQLAVLAFIGLCGVLTDSDPGDPRWLRVAAGVGALVALALACIAVFLVASVAWPFPRAGQESGAVDTPDGLGSAAGRRRLRTGVALTYAAVITMALAASASWWPDEQASFSGEGTGALVEITDHNGATACGELLSAPTGTVRIETASGTLEVATAALAGVVPADAC
jgi:hypothetical protein